MNSRDQGLHIALAADGDRTIGLGHVTRCVALAEAFTEIGEKPVVVPPAGALREFPASRGMRTGPLEQCSWDLLVVDTFRPRPRRLARWRRASRMLAVVDDLALGEAAGIADLTLRLVPGRASSGRIIGGTPYVTLRREYWHARRARIRPSVGRVLVTLGGFPPRTLMADVLRTVQKCLPGCDVHAAIGGARGHLPAASLEPLMREADLVITAGGQTLLELLALGVPSLVIGVADNQRANIGPAQRARAVVFVGWLDQADLTTRLAAAVTRCAASPRLRRGLAARGQRLIDGQGALRVARLLRDRARHARNGRA